MEAYAAQFYTTHPETNRTLRMDTGGLCQLCARKAEQRVELYSPLWQAGPLMYGECCLPQAEAALRETFPAPAFLKAAEAAPLRKPRPVWLTAAVAAGVGFLAMSVERLLQVALF